MAGLAVRRPRHAPLRPGGRAVRRRAGWCDRYTERSRRMVQLMDSGRVPCWLGTGGGFFGRVGDLIGRSRALCLTILTYALFTGLAYFAQTWWQLLIVRFLAALGIGGEWAVGARCCRRRGRAAGGRGSPRCSRAASTSASCSLRARLSCWRARAPAWSSWSVCCRPSSSFGSAGQSPRPTNGYTAKRQANDALPALPTCSAARYGARPFSSSWFARSA